MKAAVCSRYGPPEVLQIREVDDPRPGSSDALIRIGATAVTTSETYIRSGIPAASPLARLIMRVFMGFNGPRRSIMGAVVAGTVERTGRNVNRFRVGDRVMGFTMMRQGCYAEQVALPQSAKLLTRAPSNLTDAEVAAIPYGGLIALFFLRRARIQRGEDVAVYGASGAIGTIAVQIAKYFGARVTAICSGSNPDLVRSIGADHVFDYTRDELPSDARFDVVLDAVGRKKTSAMKHALNSALTPAGRKLSVDDSLPRMNRADLEFLRDLAESGSIRPVIDREYPLAEIADAHRYVEQGHKRGNVIITIDK